MLADLKLAKLNFADADYWLCDTSSGDT